MATKEHAWADFHIPESALAYLRNPCSPDGSFQLITTPLDVAELCENIADRYSKFVDFGGIMLNDPDKPMDTKTLMSMNQLLCELSGFCDRLYAMVHFGTTDVGAGGAGLLRRVAECMRDILVCEPHIMKHPYGHTINLYTKERIKCLYEGNNDRALELCVGDICYLIYGKILLCGQYSRSDRTLCDKTSLDFKTIARTVVLCPSDKPIMQQSACEILLNLMALSEYWTHVPYCEELYEFMELLEMRCFSLMFRTVESSEIELASFLQPVLAGPKTAYRCSFELAVICRLILSKIRRWIVPFGCFPEVIDGWDPEALANLSPFKPTVAFDRVDVGVHPAMLMPGNSQVGVIYQWVQSSIKRFVSEHVTHRFRDYVVKYRLTPGLVDTWNVYVTMPPDTGMLLQTVFPVSQAVNIIDECKLGMSHWSMTDPSSYPCDMQIVLFLCFITLMRTVFESDEMEGIVSVHPGDTADRLHSLQMMQDPTIVSVWNEVSVMYQHSIFRCVSPLHALGLFLNIIVFTQRGLFLGNGSSVIPVLKAIYGEELQQKLSGCELYEEYNEIFESHLQQIDDATKGNLGKRDHYERHHHGSGGGGDNYEDEYDDSDDYANEYDVLEI